MTKLMTHILLLSAFLLGVPLMAQADKLLSPEQMERRIASQQAKATRIERMQQYHKDMRERGHGVFHGGKKASKVPELDPSAGGSAAVLIAGGAMVLLGRRRRQLNES